MRRFIAAIMLLSLAAPAAAPAYTVREVRRRAVDVEREARFTLVNGSGAVSIEGWEEDRIDISAEIRVDAPSKSKAKRLCAGVTIVVEAGRKTVAVRSELPRIRQVGFAGGVFGRRTSISIRYRVKLPRGMSLAVESANGDLSIDGAEGAFSCRTGRGEIVIRAFRGGGEAKTGSGGIECSIEELPAGSDLTLEAVGGPITLALPDGAGGALEARALNGRIDVGVDVRAVERTGRHTFGGIIGRGDGTIRLRTVNGPIVVRPFRTLPVR